MAMAVDIPPITNILSFPQQSHQCRFSSIVEQVPLSTISHLSSPGTHKDKGSGPMKLSYRIMSAAGLAAMLATAACTTDPETGNRQISKAAIGGVGGALGGYLLGDLVGGRHDRTEKILGAGIGAVAGAGIG